MAITRIPSERLQDARLDGFLADRVRIARHFWALTISQLGEQVGASPQFISKLETGEREPGSEFLDALCAVLDFRPEFFYAAPKPLHDEKACNFRRRRATSKTLQKQAVAHSQLFALFVDYLDERLELPRVNFPDIPIESEDDIEDVAQRCRAEWGLGSQLPIKNMSRVLENAGAVIVKYDGETRSKVDAFSVIRSRPAVVMNREKDSPSRWVWDSAHECGHLVMHQKRLAGDVEMEGQADKFAAAFLLPGLGFQREFPKGRVDWAAIFELKRRWRVSASAIVRRAYDLSLIDSAQYRRSYKYIHYRGWQKGEPFEFGEEQPELVTSALAYLEQRHKLFPGEIARELGWGNQVFRKVVDVNADIDPDPKGTLHSIEEFRKRKVEGRS